MFELEEPRCTLVESDTIMRVRSELISKEGVVFHHDTERPTSEARALKEILS